MPTMVYLVAVMAGVTVRRPGLWYIFKFREVTTMLYSSHTQPALFLQKFLYTPCIILLLGKNEVTYYVYPKWDLFSLLVLLKTYSFAMLPPLSSSLSSEDVWFFSLSPPTECTHSFSVQHMKGLQSHISRFVYFSCPVHMSCSPFSLHYPSLNSFMMCSSLDFPDVASTSVLLLFMMGSETHGTFWRWLIMTGNPTEE